VRGLLDVYFPPLPRPVYTLQAGGLVNAFGNGLVIPFMLIYLNEVRDIDVAIAGLIVATHAVVGILAGAVFGSQIDRFGGKRMLALSLVILMVGYASYALVYEAWQGFLVAIVSGIGMGGFWPAQSTLVTGLTPAEQRPSAFAMQRVVMNLGIGLGAMTGGLIANADSPGTFVAIFLLDAVTFLGYAAVMLALVPEPDLRASGHASRAGSYREVFAHRAYMAVIALNALFILAGYSGFDVLPLYASRDAGLSETQIGLLFFVNTLIIVFAQLPIAHLSRGRRRMPALALFGALWAGAWLLVPVAGAAVPETAFLILMLVMSAFAIGQCLHGAVAAPLAADLAEPRLMGRYMALNALSWQLGFALGPALGGAGLAVSPNGVWIAAAALCAIGAACAFVVEGTLPSRARRNPRPAVAT
jgi:MFS family permease